jgi:hypothetical protein
MHIVRRIVLVALGGTALLVFSGALPAVGGSVLFLLPQMWVGSVLQSMMSEATFDQVFFTGAFPLTRLLLVLKIAVRPLMPIAFFSDLVLQASIALACWYGLVLFGRTSYVAIQKQVRRHIFRS